MRLQICFICFRWDSFQLMEKYNFCTKIIVNYFTHTNTLVTTVEKMFFFSHSASDFYFSTQNIMKFPSISYTHSLVLFRWKCLNKKWMQFFYFSFQNKFNFIILFFVFFGCFYVLTNKKTKYFYYLYYFLFGGERTNRTERTCVDCLGTTQNLV